MRWASRVARPCRSARQSGQSSPQESPATRRSHLAQGTSGNPPGNRTPELLRGGGAAEVAGADVVPHDRVARWRRGRAGPGRARPGDRASSRRRASGPTGLAMPLPAMSGALPCTASKIAAVVPMLAPGARPSPPTSPETSSLRMSPNMLVVTITSNCSGRMHQLHGGVVDDHVVRLHPALVLLRDRAADLEEEPAHHLEDVRLVDDRDLLPAVA